MRTWRIYYYKTANTICHKDIQAETSEKAIRKARIKNIISLKEM